MQEYVSLTSGHMEFLIRALDGDPGTIRPARVAAAADDGGPGAGAGGRGVSCAAPACRSSRASNGRRAECRSIDLNGRIPAELQAQPGKALCVWGDAGWGGLGAAGQVP